MNKLPLAKRVQILSLLCEGSSMRSISRVADVSINTVTKLLGRCRDVCAAYHDQHVRIGSNRSASNAMRFGRFAIPKKRTSRLPKPLPMKLAISGRGPRLMPIRKLIVSWGVGDRTAKSRETSWMTYRRAFQIAMQLTS